MLLLPGEVSGELGLGCRVDSGLAGLLGDEGGGGDVNVVEVIGRVLDLAGAVVVVELDDCSVDGLEVVETVVATGVVGLVPGLVVVGAEDGVTGLVGCWVLLGGIVVLLLDVSCVGCVDGSDWVGVAG